jgi:hypothetical protein
MRVRTKRWVKRRAVRSSIVRWRSLLAVAALFGSASFFSVPAEAAVAQCGAASAYYDGYQQAPSTYGFEGARANIVSRAAALCTSDKGKRQGNSAPTNYSDEWTMIANGNATADGWAQSGIETDYGFTGMYGFAQQFQGNHGSMQTIYAGSATPTGQTHLYTQWWDPACSCFHSDVDTTVYLASTWDPYASWSEPFAPQFFGETGYLADDIAGTSAAPTQFTSLGGERGDNDQWEAYPCILTPLNQGATTRSDGKKWHLQATTCPAFNNYTQ